MAERAEPELDRAAGVRLIVRLEQEYSNIRAAIAWSTKNAVEIALRLAAALERFNDNQGHWRDERDWLEKALAASQNAKESGFDRWRAKAFAALCASTLSPWSALASVAAGEQSVALWRTVGDKRGLAHALLCLALAHTYEARDPGVVLTFLEESAALQRDTKDAMGLPHTVFYLAYFTFIQGQREKAILIAEEACELARKAGDIIRAAGATGLRGMIAAEEGSYGEAQSLVERSLEQYRETKDYDGLLVQLLNLGAIAHFRDNYGQAHSCYEEVFGEPYSSSPETGVIEKICMGFLSLRENLLDRSVSLFREGIALLRSRDSPWARQCLCACCTGIAAVKALRGHLEDAALILGGAESTIRAPYYRLAWGWHHSAAPTLIRREFERIWSQVREALGGSAFDALREQRTRSLEETIEIALDNPRSKSTA